MAALIALAAGVLGWANARRAVSRGHRETAFSSAGLLHVPHAPAPIKIDAETEGKSVWEGDRGNTQNFRDADGRGMVPYTEARFRWGDGKLYALLYAGDLDLEGSVRDRDGPVERDDAFRLEVRSGGQTRVVVVTVLGTIADRLCSGTGERATCDPSWDSHAEVAVDQDGTLNHVGDNDEEWVIEMAIPFSSLGIADAREGSRIEATIRRCEVGHGANPCGSWGERSPTGQLELDP